MLRRLQGRFGLILTLLIVISFPIETIAGDPEPPNQATPAATPAATPELSPSPTDDAIDGPVIVETPETPETTPPALGPGWIAYTQASGEEDQYRSTLRLIRPDGSGEVIASAYAGNNPSWSHDGTMLAYNGPTAPEGAVDDHRGIWILSDGDFTKIPESEGCSLPAFSGDSTRVMFVCPGDAHAARPTAAPIPDHLAMVPALDIYIPTLSYLGTIQSAAIDGSDVRVEYKLSIDDAATIFGNPVGDVMVLRLDVQPDTGGVLVVFADAAHEPSAAGGVIFDAQFNVTQSIVLDEFGVVPIMLLDGTILTSRSCGRDGCPNGEIREYYDLEGNQVEMPGFFMKYIGPAWTSEMNLDGTAVVNWNYRQGVWITHSDGSETLLSPSSATSPPAWQPVPVEITIPATQGSGAIRSLRP